MEHKGQIGMDIRVVVTVLAALGLWAGCVGLYRIRVHAGGAPLVESGP